MFLHYDDLLDSTQYRRSGIGICNVASTRSENDNRRKGIDCALTFVPVPLALLAIGLSKHVASNYILLIPFVELIAMGAACVGEIAFFVRPRGGKNALRQSRGFSMMAGSDIRRLIVSLAIAFILLLIPIGIYSATFIQTSSHSLSLYLMLVAAFIEATRLFWGLLEERRDEEFAILQSNSGKAIRKVEQTYKRQESKHWTLKKRFGNK